MVRLQLCADGSRHVCHKKLCRQFPSRLSYMPIASQYGLQLIDLRHQAYHSFRGTCKDSKMETQRIIT